MISTVGMLKRELKDEDDFLTVDVDGQEFIIDCVARRKDYFDSLSSHLCLVCRDGGSGNIKR